MRPRWIALLSVVVLGALLGAMVFAPPVTGTVDAASMRKAREAGWRDADGPSTSQAGPLSAVRISTTSYERHAASVLVGKFYVVSIKSPVWLPESVLTDLTDDYLQDLARSQGVRLEPRTPQPFAGDDAVLLEYKGTPTSGSLFGTDELGVIARLLPCDARGNVVVAAGFASTAAPSGGGLLGSSTSNVYAKEVRGVLAPAVSCA